MVFHVKPVDNFVEKRLRRITFNKSMGNRFKSFTIKAIVYICIRMLLLCLSMLLCMYSYVSRMYLYVTRMYVGVGEKVEWYFMLSQWIILSKNV